MSDVLDAFALVAVARDEPAAADVEALLHRGQCCVTTTNFAEVAGQLHRVDGLGLDQIEADLGPLLGVGIELLELDLGLTWRAVSLRARHYRRRSSEVSLADCVALAAAAPGSDRLATADPALARAARAEGVEVLALPDSRGRRPNAG